MRCIFTTKFSLVLFTMIIQQWTSIEVVPSLPKLKEVILSRGS